MIRSLIIDDEYPATLGLKAQLARVAPRVEVVGTAAGVDEAEELIRREQPELIFLDIMLLDGTGFDLLQRFERPSFAVIFTTAYDQFAIRAFRFAAVDYLLKPISADDLEVAVTRLSQRGSEPIRAATERLIKNEQVAPELKKLAIPEVNGIRFVPIGRIMRIEADSNYSLVMLDDGQHVVSTRGLGHYQELLEEMGFFRCHKSFLINIRQVTRFLKGKKASLEMTDGFSVPVARNAREPLLAVLEAWSL